MLQNKTPHWLWSFSIIPLYGLVQVLSKFPVFIEQYYSRGFYAFWVFIQKSVWGIFPFSVGDIGYSIFVVYIVFKIFFYAKNSRFLINSLLFLGRALGLLYLLFNLSWGLNYYRQPLTKSLNLQLTQPDSTALLQLTKSLVNKTNKIHSLLTSGTTLAVTIPYTAKEINNLAPNGYHVIASSFPMLAYKEASLKESLYAKTLSYMGYAGYLNPFTLEAQINQYIPPYRLPLVASHEIGHQLGFASERDTNFIGYLASLKHPDPYFNYAATTLALSYCFRDLNAENPEAFKSVLAQLNPGVFENFKETNLFWEAHENPLSPYFEKIFNSFLKINHQAAGVKSYGQMVQLLLAYHAIEPLK